MSAKKVDIFYDIRNDAIVCFDVFNSFLGDYLDKGYSRYVFDYKIDKNYVVKVDFNTRGSNFMEYEVWNTVKDTKFAKWFAPCKYLSPDGKLLIQRKAKELSCHSDIPKRIPAFFSDARSDNFGMLDGKMVCIDYALTNLLKKGLTKEMQEIKWELPKDCTIA